MAAWPYGLDLWRLRGRPELRLCGARCARAHQRRNRCQGHPCREASVRLFCLLSLCALHGTRRRPVARIVKLEEEVVRRQRERARITALLLGAFVVLLFFITIAKTGMNW